MPLTLESRTSFVKKQVSHTCKHVRPAALSVPAGTVLVVSGKASVSTNSDSGKYSGFEAFVSDGLVPLTENEVPVTKEQRIHLSRLLSLFVGR